MEICNVSCVGGYCMRSPIYLCRAWVRYILNFDRIDLRNEFFSCSICNLFVYSLKIFSIIMSNSLWYILAESSSIFLILFVCCSSLLEYDRHEYDLLFFLCYAYDPLLIIRLRECIFGDHFYIGCLVFWGITSGVWFLVSWGSNWLNSWLLLLTCSYMSMHWISMQCSSETSEVVLEALKVIP